MRVTASLIRDQWLSALNTTQSNIAHLQQQVATGKRFSSPSEDPIAASRVNDLQQAVAQNTQFTRNGKAAQDRLSVEESVLTQVGDSLQRLRELAVQANNSGQSNDTRKSFGYSIST